VTTLDDLERLAKTENIEIFNRQIFKDDPSATVTNLKRQVRGIDPFTGHETEICIF
jgi:hypothetical protein